jgi:hypothetical protein
LHMQNFRTTEAIKCRGLHGFWNGRFHNRYDTRIRPPFLSAFRPLFHRAPAPLTRTSQ